jgi:methylmalonyl-CoA/ethylmalonyl-CoA epimerase
LAIKLHHVGIVVPDEEQVQMLLSLLGLNAGRRQYVAQYDADCVFTLGEGGVIEFIIPRGGKLTQFNKGMGGLHHIALQVADLEALARDLKDKQVDLLEPDPVDAGPIRINFLPPVYTRGLIVEFIEPVVHPGFPSENGPDQ